MFKKQLAHLVQGCLTINAIAVSADADVKIHNDPKTLAHPIDLEAIEIPYIYCRIIANLDGILVRLVDLRCGWRK